MKKYLLILSVIFAITANAQKQITVSPEHTAKAVNKTLVYPELNKPVAIPSTQTQLKHGGQTNYNTAINVIPIGQAGNALGCGFGARPNLWYDKDLNMLSFVHRSDPVASFPSNGCILYDGSTDGGHTWNQINKYLYDSTAVANTHRGRYPNGVIYNPPGNTNPSDAYITAYGPITDGTNWIEHYKGTSKYGSSSKTQGLYPFTSGLNAIVPDGYQIVKNTRTIWASSACVLPPAQSGYDDSIVLSKGTFNNGNVDYSFSSFYAPMQAYATNSIAWNDAGDIGYVAIIGNQDTTLWGATYYLIVYKTTDGGNSWNRVGDKANINIDALDTVLNDPGITCTTAFELDCAVDKNNNLHVSVAVGLWPGNFSIATGPGNWGIFDIYTTDNGATWYAELLCYPQTFRGNFGAGTTADPDVPEDSRPQVSRSWDGSIISFTWFDTDTLVFGSGIDNQFCNMFVRSFDINTNKWTSRCNNLTVGTQAEAFCTFGNVSYYSISNGTEECIPMVYGQLASAQQTGSTMGFNYVDGACLSASSYSENPDPKRLVIDDGVAKDPAKSTFSVSSNYPNPFNGSTSFDVTLPKPSDVTVEISNIVGQTVSTQSYKNLNAGNTQLTIDASGFSSGLYIYKVKVGNEVITGTMTVK